MTFLFVDTREALTELLDVLVSEPRIALDTEFHRERTYFPRLALVQVAWSDGVAIIDPLAVDIAPITRIFGDGNLIVLHAAQQDMDVLTHAVGSVPNRMFDTQIAAGFLGFSTPSLASLVNAELKISLPKGDRLTDWLRRPSPRASWRTRRPMSSTSSNCTTDSATNSSTVAVSNGARMPARNCVHARPGRPIPPMRG